MNTINHQLLAMKFAQSGFTFRSLEKETLVSRTTLHHVMKGSHAPSHAVALQLNKALLLTYDEIMAIYFPETKLEKEHTI